MSLIDELERLQALHDGGTLTDAEFADAKAKVLAEGQPQPAAANSSVQHDLRRLQVQNEILSLDQNWSADRENYMLRTRYGSYIVPNAARSLTGGIVVSVIFMGLILFGANIPHGGLLVIIGVLGIIASVASGLSNSSKADAYDAAYEQYQQKRRDLTDQLAALGE